MTSAFRRFEILLPLRLNDGQPVSGKLIADTLLELETQFGAVSSETSIIEGQWRHQGRTYRDDLTRIFVDVPDTPASFEFFRGFKEKLKVRFQQIDIWIATYPVQII